MMRTVYMFVCLLAGCNLFLSPAGVRAGQDAGDDRRQLLSRLNQDFPGLEEVKANAENPDIAMEKLLTYFRNGGSGKHPIDKNARRSFSGNCATPNDIKAADNALKHIFTGQGAYPPYFCGE
ncbi:MAG: hypothetical protein LBB90_06460, partial [Tannerella sp.]|nr:hypothetical protein [Tannerella sp.]